MIKKISHAVLNFLKTYYNLLLISLVLLFIFRPYNQSLAYLAIWKILLTAMVLAAVFNCKRSPNIKRAELSLAIPTIIFCWLDLLIPHPTIFVINTFFNIFFTLLCTATIIHDVLVKIKVNTETLKGVICAYFLVAIAFAYIFWIIEYFEPNSFFNSTGHVTLDYYTQYLSEMIYFSFVTLLTIGFGDIVAVKDTAQTAVILEGIIGQFYVAILVARLVATYSFYAQVKLFAKQIDKKAPLDKPDDPT